MKPTQLLLLVSLWNIFSAMPANAYRYNQSDRQSSNIIDRRISTNTSYSQSCLSSDPKKINSGVSFVAEAGKIGDIYADPEKKNVIWNGRGMKYIDHSLTTLETVKNSKGELLVKFHFPKELASITGRFGDQDYIYMDFPNPSNEVRLFGCEKQEPRQRNTYDGFEEIQILPPPPRPPLTVPDKIPGLR